MLKKILVIVFLSMSVGVAFAQDTPASKAAACLAILDIDVDGVLHKMECTNQMMEQFKEFDANKDSFLDLEELTAYYTKLEQNSGEKK